MKRLFVLLLFAFAFLATSVEAQNTTLTGHLLANGQNFTGTLWLTLTQPATVLTTGGCGGPYYLVPNISVPIQVVNGVLQGTPKVWGADCMNPGVVPGATAQTGIPYNVKLVDTNNNTLTIDQWIILGSTFDVGTAQSILSTQTSYVGVPGAQGVPGPNCSLSSPTGHCSLGTTILDAGGVSANSVNGVYNVALFTGSDLGAQLTAALASGPVWTNTNGVPIDVLYPASLAGADGSVPMSTPADILAGSDVDLGDTLIRYNGTGTYHAALRFGNPSRGGGLLGVGDHTTISNFALVQGSNDNTNTYVDDTASVGLAIGGGVQGITSGGQGYFLNVHDATFVGWHEAIQAGNNNFTNFFHNVFFNRNYNVWNETSTAFSNRGENTSISQAMINNNVGNAFNFGIYAIAHNFTDVSCDYSNFGGYAGNSYKTGAVGTDANACITGNQPNVAFINGHLENRYGQHIYLGGGTGQGNGSSYFASFGTSWFDGDHLEDLLVTQCSASGGNIILTLVDPSGGTNPGVFDTGVGDIVLFSGFSAACAPLNNKAGRVTVKPTSPGWQMTVNSTTYTGTISSSTDSGTATNTGTQVVSSAIISSGGHYYAVLEVPAQNVTPSTNWKWSSGVTPTGLTNATILNGINLVIQNPDLAGSQCSQSPYTKDTCLAADVTNLTGVAAKAKAVESAGIVKTSADPGMVTLYDGNGGGNSAVILVGDTFSSNKTANVFNLSGAFKPTIFCAGNRSLKSLQISSGITTLSGDTSDCDKGGFYYQDQNAHFAVDALETDFNSKAFRTVKVTNATTAAAAVVAAYQPNLPTGTWSDMYVAGLGNTTGFMQYSLGFQYNSGGDNLGAIISKHLSTPLLTWDITTGAFVMNYPITFANLSGTGTRTLQVDSTGLLSASTGSSSIANIQITTGIAAIGANSCTANTATPMTGLSTTSAVIPPTPTTSTVSVTGWGANGGLGFVFDTHQAGTLNWSVCNTTSSSITPGASVTWNVGAR